MWGIVLLLYWSALPRSFLSTLYKLFSASALVLCISLSLQLLLLASDMAGTTHWSELRLILTDVVAMHAGSVFLWQLICSLLAGIWALFPFSHTLRRLLTTLLLLGMTTFKAAAGHAAADGSFSVREISQWLHLVSIASWAGSILVATAIVLPRLNRNDETLSLFLHRLSLQATISVAAVFLSGLFNTCLITEGQLTAIRSSTWGTVLMVKIALVLLALGIGVLNRSNLRGELTTNTLALLVKRIRLEALVMLVVLCVSGWLGNLSPT